MLGRDSPFSLSKYSSKKPKPSTSISGHVPNFNKGEAALLAKNQAAKQQVAEMIDRLESLRLAIEDKVDVLSKMKGVTREQIWEFVTRKENFTSEEWALIEKENYLFTEKIAAIAGKGRADLASANKEITVANKEITGKEITGSRKGKYLGARRNWISTR